MGYITTHPGGPFYVWYVSVYGYAPPSQVNDQAARYLAWQQGMAKGLAAGIPYGAIGPPGQFIVGQAIIAPILVTTPTSPTPIVAPAATQVEQGVTVVAPFASPAPAGPAPGGPLAGAPVAAPAATTTWYAVVASREVLGGEGACRAIQARGYSELSNDPAQRDFSALGHIPCLTGLYIRNPGNGKSVGAVKQDVGAGSSFLPSMGLYPQTIADIGLDPTAAEYHIQIRRQDGKPMNIPRGATVQISDSSTPATPSGETTQGYFNPLKHANVTPERIDQGVDYAGTGYLVAIADGVVTRSIANGSGWEGEGYIEYKVTQPGFLDGVYIYYAEGVNTVVSEGEQVKGGNRICNLRVPMPNGIEIGFAAGEGEESYYAYHDGKYGENNEATRPGIAFSNLIVALGGPAGKIEGAVVGKFPEFMPDGFPPSGVTTGVETTPLSGGPQTIPEAVAASAYTFPRDLYSAFVQLQRGITAGSHHSHAAQQYANGVTYVPKSA